MNIVLTLCSNIVYQNQLRDILMMGGFPEECLMPQSFNFNGEDANLDMVGSYLIKEY